MQELFKRYLNNQCSTEEVELLLKELDLEKNNELLSKLISEQLDAEEVFTSINEKDQENILTHMYQNIKARIKSG